MSAKKIFLITLAVILIFAAALIFLTAKKMFTPTTGDRIGNYTDPGKALLVIDVQEDYTGLKGKQPVPYKNVDSQIAIINRLVDKASRSGMKIVYIRHLYENNLLTRLLIRRGIEGLPGTELDARIKVVNGNDFTKKISDSFSNPQLGAFLINNRVNELYLVGLDAAYCVYNTAMGALNRGYTVTVVDDAIMTQKNMSEVLKKYEKDGIQTLSSSKMSRM
jgi:nicotinamidase/pyrazinamidase